RPLLNGESGSYTPAMFELAKRTASAPDHATLRFLQLTPAQTMVLHLDRMDPSHREQWRTVDLSSYGFQRACAFREAIVWERRDPPPVPSPTLRPTGVSWKRHIGRWREGWQVEISVQVDESHPTTVGWRSLQQSHFPVDVVLEDQDGNSFNYSSKASF